VQGVPWLATDPTLPPTYSLFVGSGSALRNGGPAGILIAWILIGAMCVYSLVAFLAQRSGWLTDPHLRNNPPRLINVTQALGEMAIVFPVSGGQSRRSSLLERNLALTPQCCSFAWQASTLSPSVSSTRLSLSPWAGITSSSGPSSCPSKSPSPSRPSSASLLSSTGSRRAREALISVPLLQSYWNNGLPTAAWITIFWAIIMIVSIFGTLGFAEEEYVLAPYLLPRPLC
jgi:amino acid transporter